mgnify:FL=1
MKTKIEARGFMKLHAYNNASHGMVFEMVYKNDMHNKNVRELCLIGPHVSLRQSLVSASRFAMI